MTTTTDPRPTPPGRPAPWRPRLDPRPMPNRIALSLDAGHRAMRRIRAMPCDRHHAPAGAPCWSLPADRDVTAGGFCGLRVAVSRPTGGTGPRKSRRREGKRR